MTEPSYSILSFDKKLTAIQAAVIEKYLSPLLRNILARVAVSCYVAFAVVAGCQGNSARLAETKQLGNQVVKAVKEYYSDHQKYPLALSELVPKYTKEIPKPTWGLREWVYKLGGDEQGFLFGVNETTHTGDGNSKWLRYSLEHGWDIGD
jgi:hypothetical protein